MTRPGEVVCMTRIGGQRRRPGYRPRLQIGNLKSPGDAQGAGTDKPKKTSGTPPYHSSGSLENLGLKDFIATEEMRCPA
jgi:hypothetical protein